MAHIGSSVLSLLLLASGPAIDQSAGTDAESLELSAETAAQILSSPKDKLLPNTEDEAAELIDTSKEVGIPGAVVALIFGVFGLLVVARRKSR